MVETVLICLSPGDTSLSYYMRHLGVGFKNKGYNVVYIFDQKSIPKDLSEDYIAYCWPNKRPTSWADFVFLKSLIREYKPHLIMASFGAVNIAMITARLFGVRHRFAWYHTISKQIIIDKKLAPFKVWSLYFRKRLILKATATRILTNSENTKRDIISRLKLNPNNIKCLDLLTTNPAKKCNLKREQKIVMTGRLQESKGHRHLLNTVPFLIKDFPSLKIVLLGGGILETELRNLAKSLEIESYIEFRGFVSREVVFEELSTAKMHVSMSLEEAFGMVNIEALATGTPILGPNVGGISGIIDDGKNGYFINPLEYKATVQRMATILKDDVLFNQLSRQAKESFTERFLLSEENIESQISKILH